MCYLLPPAASPLSAATLRQYVVSTAHPPLPLLPHHYPPCCLPSICCHRLYVVSTMHPPLPSLPHYYPPLLPLLYLLPQTVVSTTVGGVSLECSMGTDNDYQIPKAMIAVCNDHK